MRAFFAGILLATLAVLSPTASRARVLEVPNKYSTVQFAVDMALPGDTVRIHAGVYGESVLVFSTFGVNIVGEPGTIMAGSMVPSQAAISLFSPGNSVSGLTIRNYDVGVAILASGHVDHCTVTGCNIGIYTSVFGDRANLPPRTQVDHNLVTGNGDGIYLDNCENVSVDHNTATLNGDGIGGAGIYIQFSDTCVIDHNVADGNGEGIQSFFGVTDCSFMHNTAAHNETVDIEEDSPGFNTWKQNEFAPGRAIGI
ncbi:MAG TPA: NosD domain-containing protein [Chthonomonadaceae bacterium]|nr:NosD domain-containing protein [Chthonomonadaceae bacterium]